MSPERAYRFATAAAAVCYLTAGVARPAVDYARFHRLDLAWIGTLSIASIAAVIIGGCALIWASLLLKRLSPPEAAPPTHLLKTAAVLTAILVAVGLGIAFAIYRLHQQFGGEGRLWQDMVLHGIWIVPGLAALASCVRGPDRFARS